MSRLGEFIGGLLVLLSIPQGLFILFITAIQNGFKRKVNKVLRWLDEE